MPREAIHIWQDRTACDPKGRDLSFELAEDHNQIDEAFKALGKAGVTDPGKYKLIFDKYEGLKCRWEFFVNEGGIAFVVAFYGDGKDQARPQSKKAVNGEQLAMPAPNPNGKSKVVDPMIQSSLKSWLSGHKRPLEVTPYESASSGASSS